jgi:hypothetical protein
MHGIIYTHTYKANLNFNDCAVIRNMFNGLFNFKSEFEKYHLMNFQTPDKDNGL